MQNFDAASFTIVFDPAVLRLDNVTDGTINGVTVPVQSWIQSPPGRYLITVNVSGSTGISGSGLLSELHLHCVGGNGTSSNITIVHGAISPAVETLLRLSCTDASVGIGTISGDANYDGTVNVVDITSVIKMILMQLDSTDTGDANQDGTVNVYDISKIARMILGID